MLTTDDLAGIIVGIAHDEGYRVQWASCGPTVHRDGENLGVVTALGHSVSLYYSCQGGPGLSIRTYSTFESGLSAALDWLYPV